VGFESSYFVDDVCVETKNAIVLKKIKYLFGLTVKKLCQTLAKKSLLQLNLSEINEQV
jgi:hypothetical protein